MVREDQDRSQEVGGRESECDVGESPASRATRRGWLALGMVLLAGACLRVGYLLAQPGSDPFLAHPFVDGALYLEWARGLVAGTWDQEGAFYHAPLYPHVLSWMLRLTGDSVRGVFALQELLSLGTAGLLGWLSLRRAGAVAGAATAALVAFHQPVVFFAATPMGETLALFLLAAGLAAREGRSLGARGLAGLLFGLAALSRPNFLLIGLVLGASDLWRRDWRRAGLFAAGAALALVPVAGRNLSASGHFVPISSNGGVTLYHGNAPGARGIYRPIPGTSGDPRTQRAETTALARARSGLELDPVEADAWWGAEARAARLEAPADTLGLLGWRLLLALDDYEHSLDYDPLLDANPWRPVLRIGSGDAPGSGLQVFLVPFALLLALAVVALVARGPRGSGGVDVWGPVLACLATPVLFYVSSRYRLPFAVLLALPAGIGVAALARTVPARLGAGVVAGALALALSLAVPSGELAATGRRQSLANRLGVLTQAGDFEAAETAGATALALGPSYELHFNLGYLYERSGRSPAAVEQYAAAFALDGTRPEAARALGLQLARQGRFAEALVPLEAAARTAPRDGELWAALAASYRETGDAVGLQDTLRRAAEAGVPLRADR